MDIKEIVKDAAIGVGSIIVYELAKAILKKVKERRAEEDSEDEQE